MPAPLYGQVTVSSSAQVLSAPTSNVTAFTIKAATTNANPVYLGDKNVTTGNGHILSPGDEFDYQRSDQNGQARFELKPSDFYVIGTASDKVSWLASP